MTITSRTILVLLWFVSSISLDGFTYFILYNIPLTLMITVATIITFFLITKEKKAEVVSQ